MRESHISSVLLCNEELPHCLDIAVISIAAVVADATRVMSHQIEPLFY